MHFDPRTAEHMQGVHPDLVRLFQTFQPPLPIKVVDGIRTVDEQQEMVATGASKTMNSRHLTGHAVDFAVFDNSGRFVKVIEPYAVVAKALKAHAKRLGIAIDWGGDWDSPNDGMHIQLSWDAYPLAAGHKTAGNSKTIAAAAATPPLVALVPDIMKALEGASEALKGFSEEWAGTVQLVLMMAIAAFIIWERIKKMRTEGV